MLKRLLSIARGSGTTDINYLIYPTRRVFIIPVPSECIGSGTYRVTKNDGNLFVSIETADSGQARLEMPYAEIQKAEKELQ
jgi:hypothetical protein